MRGLSRKVAVPLACFLIASSAQAAGTEASVGTSSASSGHLFNLRTNPIALTRPNRGWFEIYLDVPITRSLTIGPFYSGGHRTQMSTDWLGGADYTAAYHSQGVNMRWYVGEPALTSAVVLDAAFGYARGTMAAGENNWFAEDIPTEYAPLSAPAATLGWGGQFFIGRFNADLLVRYRYVFATGSRRIGGLEVNYSKASKWDLEFQTSIGMAF